MANRLTQAEREWFQPRVSGATPATSVNDLKRRFFVSQIGGSSASIHSLKDLEKQWLRRTILNFGNIPVDTRYAGQLWKQAVSSLGEIPSNYETQNKIIFYQSAQSQLMYTILTTSGLLGYWPLNEATGNVINIANDTIGTLDGTNTGATVGQTGQVGRAYSFDGNNDFISIADNDVLDGMANVSILFMLSVPDTSVFQKLFFKNAAYDFGINDGGRIFGELNSIGNPGTWDDTIIDDGAWRMFCITYDGATMRMYINGSEVENLGSLSGSVGAGSGALELGRHADNQNEYFDGLMQHVALFDTALSAAQALKLAQISGLA